MIDMHSHIFNLAYVPIRGILEAWGVPPRLARPAARIFDQLTRVDETPRSALDQALAGAFASDIELATTDLIFDVARSAPAADLEAVSSEVTDAIAYLDSIGTEGRTTHYDATLLLEAEMLGTDRERLARVIRAVGRRVVGKTDTLRWFLLMMNRESVVVDHLLGLWDAGASFVHHMMDMDAHYPHGRSRFDFLTEQVQRLTRLAGHHTGRLRSFVAWCPIRENAVDVVAHALSTSDCIGVKFYPPNGYKPWQNTDGDIYGNATADDVNRRNMDLFRLCVRRDVPLFAHCSRGGMERVRGKTGTYSDPVYWRQVLTVENLGTLRLCLGHAGGAEGWTTPHGPYGDQQWEQSWACAVVSLCTEYPNVYCEFGHLDAVLDDELRSKFLRRLERVVEATRGARYPFARKMMFGSDWHLVSRVPQYRELARVWREMVRRSVVLAPWEHAITTVNAMQYLQLPPAPET